PYDLARLAKYATSFTLGRLRGRRAMLDDPFALFSTRWFTERLGCRAVVLVRDPVSLVGSWQRLGWQIHFHELLEQPLLVRDLLGCHTEQLRSLIGSYDHVARTANLWRVAYEIVDRCFAGLPGVLVQRYEDLVSDPATGFAKLYDFFGLTFSSRARDTVAAATGAKGGRLGEGSHRFTMRFGWSKTAFRPMDSRTALTSYRDRLNPAEIARVREITAEVAGRLYPAESATRS
ncbi:MAG: hypothetical protein ACRDT8_01295, partial [Micromonosporaceae bacterium]